MRQFCIRKARQSLMVSIRVPAFFSRTLGIDGYEIAFEKRNVNAFTIESNFYSEENYFFFGYSRGFLTISALQKKKLKFNFEIL